MSTFQEEFKKFSTPEQIIKTALRLELASCLEQLFPHQLAKFRTLYPEGINKLSEKKLKSAIDICHRTMAKNNLDDWIPKQ